MISFEIFFKMFIIGDFRLFLVLVRLARTIYSLMNSIVPDLNYPAFTTTGV